jgi:PAS domain S-box-containing protein
MTPARSDRQATDTDSGQNARTNRLVQDVLIGEAVAQAGYVVLVADEQMRYLAASASACELLGYSNEEILDLTVTDVVVDDEVFTLYDGFLASGHQKGRVSLRCKDGRRVVAEYDARATRVSRLPYYVSILSPLGSLD